MEITVVGSIGLDGVETPFGEVNDVLGGAAVYFSSAASNYVRVNLVGVVGEDFPDEHLSYLKSLNVDLRGLEVAQGPTFRWSGKYEYDLNVRHTISTDLNVFADFHPKVPESYRKTPYVFLANIDPDLQLEVLNQIQNPKLVMMDTMDFWITGKRKSLESVMSSVNIVLMNDFELREYSGSYSLVEGARKILSLGPAAVVVKKGEHGAIMVTKDNCFMAPAYPLGDVKDPTGAGDSFAGGFFGYLVRSGDSSESNIRKAIVHGSIVASFVVEEFSLNRLKRLTKEEIDFRYLEFQNLVHFEHICQGAMECPF